MASRVGMGRICFLIGVGLLAGCVSSSRSLNAVVERAESQGSVKQEPSAVASQEAAPRVVPCPARERWPEGMACVEGGWFLRGDDEGREDERPAHRVFVDTFYMDTHEVSNARYQECIAEGVCNRPIHFRGFRRPNQPAVAMTWFDAVRFCERQGRRLPTEAEWERAARGPENTTFPWGDEARTCEAANVSDRRHGGRGCGRDITADVGSFPAGHWGLFDMAGNVHEWVADWHSDCYSGCRNACGEACQGINPRGPCGGESPCRGFRLREVRGGSWYWPLRFARGSARRGAGAHNVGPHRFGFRCARDLESSAN